MRKRVGDLQAASAVALCLGRAVVSATRLPAGLATGNAYMKYQ